jgi:hypothetical protein
VRAAAVVIALAALPAAAASRGSMSEAMTAGSGPYIGNSLSAGVSPGPLDLDLGYDFGSDENLVLYHSLWGSLGVWPFQGVRISFDGDFGPKVSSDSPDRGHYALSSAGGGASISYHPGRSGEVRPYLQIGGGVEHLEVEGSQTPGATNPVNAAFDQTSLGGTVGIDVGATALRLGASKFFYGEDAGAVQLPPGVGSGPLGLGAGQAALPTRAEDWNVRASVRQRFGRAEAWDGQLRFTYAPYVDGRGEIAAVNLRLGRDLSRSLRGYVGLTGQVETLSTTAFGLFGTAGVSVLF